MVLERNDVGIARSALVGVVTPEKRTTE